MLIVTKAQAQFNSELSFARIGLEEGLSQSTVLDIVQDSQGCLWLATQDGLNKYNGYDLQYIVTIVGIRLHLLTIFCMHWT